MIRKLFATAVAFGTVMSLLALITPAAVETSASANGSDYIATYDPLPGEKHFGTINQLTDGGENAEAYFSQDGKHLIFQSTVKEHGCDQIFMMALDGSGKKMVSTGKGRTTCSFIVGNNDYIVYSSTHHLGDECPPKPEMRSGYSWFLYDYDVFRADMDGGNVVNLTKSRSYDAEATVSPDGREIAFSSTRDGDQEIYLMNADGSNVRRITHERGYDGGPFYSWDGKKIVFRSNRPTGEKEIAEYDQAIKDGLMLRVPLEIYIMNADGTDIQQVTRLGAASFAPFLHPDGKRIIFCSNYGGSPRIFNLWMINVDGTGLERITTSDRFDGFPMFSKDGKYLVFCSNRHAKVPSDTNVFITEWKD